MKTVLRLRKNGDSLVDIGSMKITVPKFVDSKGNDWLELQKDFSEDTLKLVVDKTGMIRGHSTDITAIALSETENFTITEVDHDDLPEDFFKPENFTSWQWKAGKGVSKREIPDDENVAVNTEKKKELLTQVMQDLSPLQMAEKYGIATDEEKSRLETLERYLINVSRIDVKQRDIDWPALP